MNIKERLTQEIEAAKGKLSIVDILTELELSKDRPDHFQKRINDLKDEMTKYRISKNWISNGCIDIMHKDGFWIEEVIKVNLKDRPESEVWHEVQRFLSQYFLILEYEKCINVIDNELTDKKQWDNLYTYLTNTKYIDTTIKVFSFVMEYKHLPGGAKKIQWLSSQANAIYIFIDFAKFSYTQLNECFRSKTGNPFQRGSKPNPRSPRKPEIKKVITFFPK